MIEMIEHRALHPSPLNPRKTFDPAALADLAESLAAQGVLQNLVARPYAAEPGQYEIIAGDRRWRAAAILIERGAWPPDAPLPVAVREASDLEVLQLATAENLARDSLAPMEEAEAFAALVKAGQSTAQIAQLVGRTQRFVQLRLALIDKLAPKAQDALRAGVISVEQARALTLGDKKRQAEVLPRLLEEPGEHWNSAAEIKRDVTRKLVRVERAVFDPALYTGAIVDDPDDEAIRYFADVGQFERLQKLALAERKAALAKDWAFVEIVHHHSAALPYDWRKTPKDPKAGALIVVHAGGAAEHCGVRRESDLPRPKPARAGKAAEAPPRPEMTQGFLSLCRHRKTHALQAAIAADPDAALRAACLALMAPRPGAARLRVVALDGVDRALDLAPALAERVKPWRQRLAKWISKPASDGDDEAGPPAVARAIALRQAGWDEDEDEAADRTIVFGAMEVLDRLDRRQLLELHALLIAGLVGSFSGYRAALGDGDQVLALAASLGLAAAPGIDEPFLAACAKPQLEWMIRDLGIADAKTQGNTAAAMRKHILAHSPKIETYAPPWLRFGAAAELSALLAVPQESPLPLREGQRAKRAGRAKAPKPKPKPKKIARGVKATRKAA